MKICPVCQAQLDDAVNICPRCGTVLPAQQPVQQPAQQPVQQPVQQPTGQPTGQQPVHPPYPPQPPYGMPYRQPYAVPIPDPADHTAEFDPADIRENKLYAILIYLTSFVGIVIGLLAAKDSAFVRFHVRQAVKLMICELLLALITVLLFWTFIVPFAGGICLIILGVVQIICFFRAAAGKAIEPPIVKGIGFLK